MAISSVDHYVSSAMEALYYDRHSLPVHAPSLIYFFFNDTATTEIYTLSLHDALPICRARDQESPHGHAHRGRSTAAVRRSGGRADGRGNGGYGRRDRAAGPAREGVRRVRSPPRGAEERGGSGGPLDGPGQERRAIGGGRFGAGQRGAVQAAGALRSVAAGGRGTAAGRLRGDGRARIDRDRGEPGRGRGGGDDRRPPSPGPRPAAPARISAVLHDQE